MKLALILCDGFEDIEAIATKDILNRAGIQVTLFGEKEIVKSNHDTMIIANKIISKEITTYDGIILPGGLPGAINIKNNNDIIKYLQIMNNNEKLIAAICAAPLVLKHANVLNNKKATIYPDDEFISLLGSSYLNENIVVDKNIITASGPAFTYDFAFSILEYFDINIGEIKKGMLFE